MKSSDESVKGDIEFLKLTYQTFCSNSLCTIREFKDLYENSDNKL